MTSTIQVPTLRLNSLGLQPLFMRSDWGALLDRLPADVAEDWRAVTEARGTGSQAPDTTFAVWSPEERGRGV